ncbi:hypothetical protein V1520DRAFT_340064 [Lipomyces starkeyi]|uniref:Uricase n=1 Tax=Lipomyces starkeyi NRRL Y-11557 TaxID=675824 RepID=A0A1E3Q2Y2_LIPST|nr:hypothetical protein LIPSTDRAFT_72767 [Lipomyces starkeyi NRRL Y-11557]
MVKLSAARYGKDNIRLLKVERDATNPKLQYVFEFTIRVMLEGHIASAYTHADNAPVVTTDSMKNTTHILAKKNPVSPPELFASILGTHFVTTYDHIQKAFVHIVQHRWTRYAVDGVPHEYSFVRDGEEVRVADAEVDESGEILLSGGIADLLVLKSTGSAFYGYIQDKYTTLPETWDRIMSTAIDSTWTFKPFENLEAVRSAVDNFEEGYQSARNITLKTFALDDSASVQATLFKMCKLILAANSLINDVKYALPNKHYFEIDLSWFEGLKNTGADAQVYAPQSNPNGLITATVSRDD